MLSATEDVGTSRRNLRFRYEKDVLPQLSS